MSEHLNVYLVQVRRGPDVDQYWIGGGSPDVAMREAARLAGVGLDQVVGRDAAGQAGPALTRGAPPRARFTSRKFRGGPAARHPRFHGRARTGW